MTIDTLEYVKKLEAAGVDRKAAEAHAEALRAAIEDELATKADILRLEATTKADIQRLEANMKADIARLDANMKADIARLDAKIDAKISELRAEIMKYMIAQTFVLIGVFFALMRFVR